MTFNKYIYKLKFAKTPVTVFLKALYYTSFNLGFYCSLTLIPGPAPEFL